jgi:hypothetical protein
MFAMKRVILAAAFIITISGFAAAQSTSAKQATKQVKGTTIKKGTPLKKNSKNIVLKQEASATAKSDSAIKLQWQMPAVADSIALPKVKKDQQF